MRPPHLAAKGKPRPKRGRGASFLVAFALPYLAGFLTDGFALISQADIWVMDPAVNATEHTTNIPASALQRVRSSSAVPLALGDTEVQLRQWPVPVFPGDRVRRSDARRAAAARGRHSALGAADTRCSRRQSRRHGRQIADARIEAGPVAVAPSSRRADPPPASGRARAREASSKRTQFAGSCSTPSTSATWRR